MKKVTLEFPNLQLLAECLFQLSVQHPYIDYEKCQLVVFLPEHKVADAMDCQGVIV